MAVWLSVVNKTWVQVIWVTFHVKHLRPGGMILHDLFLPAAMMGLFQMREPPPASCQSEDDMPQASTIHSPWVGCLLLWMKFYWNKAISIYLCVFKLQWWNWIVATETVTICKPKMVTKWASKNSMPTLIYCSPTPHAWEEHVDWKTNSCYFKPTKSGDYLLFI